ncbi:MAG: hypothetical protein KAV82_01140 [Phycisphaerae bacterium]|nr:hypothetical protein [Phycisphaerae bacterium]
MRSMVVLTLGIGLLCCSLTASGGGPIEAEQIVEPVEVQLVEAAKKLPRIAHFLLDDEYSWVTMTLFSGDYESSLSGELVLHLACDLPVAEEVGEAGLSDDSPAVQIEEVARRLVPIKARYAKLVADDWDPESTAAELAPLVMGLDPEHPSKGWYCPHSGRIWLDLWLVAHEGWMPVHMPLKLKGKFLNGVLDMKGCNSNDDIADGLMCMRIFAKEVWPRPEFRYSTEIGFTPSTPTSVLPPLSDGDLISDHTCLVYTNWELISQFGFMPPVRDLGLDAATLTFSKPVWFSIEEGAFSEVLGCWVSDGDLLSMNGQIVRTNAALLAACQPAVRDLGLDAVHVGILSSSNIGILFSTERDFWSTSMGIMVGHGDLLSEHMCVYRTNAQLMANFNPYDPFTPEEPAPEPHDYGLDAVYVTRHGTIWFSVEEGFYDLNLGYVSDGDVLSEHGYVVRRNLTLMFAACSPLEDCANFGLDALDYHSRYWLTPVAEEIEVVEEFVDIAGE